MSFLQRVTGPLLAASRRATGLTSSTVAAPRNIPFTTNPSISFSQLSFTSLRSIASQANVRTNQVRRLSRVHSQARQFSSTAHGGYNFGQKAVTPTNLGIVVVPQQSAYVIERFGRYSKTLEAGLHFLVPGIDKIAYVQNLKEEAIPVANQMAITQDNVTINIDGVLYIKIVDPVKASYGVSDIYYAMVQLAQTTMRSELGKLTLDKTFAGREHLNADIVRSINVASDAWGVTCLRYEIKDIAPPHGVKQAMDMQAEAERRKRATVLDSEGAQQSEINIAEGARQSAILQAEGEAAAIIAKAQATAKGIQVLAESLQKPGGREAVSLQIASQYVDAFGHIAKAGNTMLLPSNPGDAAGMVTQALAIYENIRHKGITPSRASNSSAIDSTNTSSSSPSLTAEDELFAAAERLADEKDRR